MNALEDVLRAGQRLLQQGAGALDVVSEAVRLLEECPLFNAGRGAVYTHAGTHELDAAIMDGATLDAGAICCVTRIRNPVLAARAVLEHSDHVLFTGSGAEAFAQRHGIEFVDASFFDTDARRVQLERAQAEERTMLDHDGAHLAAGSAAQAAVDHAPLDPDTKFGTVGAVALDAHGNLAAATSTGGMTNKQPGRVGDSALIGAGCYANNATCAVSATGTGEMFIRSVAAYDVSAQMEYACATLDEAARRVVYERLPRIGGSGGLIAIDAEGNVALPFNTEGMYRGHAYADGAPVAAIYR